MKKWIVLAAFFMQISGMAEENQTMTVTVALQTPHPGFGLQIERAVHKDGTLHVLARVLPPAEGGMFPMVIDEVRDTVRVGVRAKDVKTYVYNRTWSWDDERVTAIESAEAFAEKTEGGTPVEISPAADDETNR